MNLKPCPFCGNPHPRLHAPTQPESRAKGIHYVICDTCYAITSFGGQESQQATVQAYNLRQDGVTKQ